MKGRKKADLPKHKDGVDILVCKILVWEPQSKTKIDTHPDEKQCLVIRECDHIEINETYKELIDTAVVRFPRGTVIHKTLTPEVIEKEGVPSVSTERQMNGAILEKRAGSHLLTPKDFKTGQRIRIYLGYYRDSGKVFKTESERLQTMEDEALPANPNFDGYIIKCSVSDPIEIKCENLASVLKNKTCKERKIPDAKVNDFLTGDKETNLLLNTGLKLHPDTKKCDISIGAVHITDDLTVADVLANWSKFKLYCFLRNDKDGNPCVQVGRSYFSNKTAESIVKNDQSDQGTLIEFDYHVAKDNLTLMNTDPRLLAVEAQSCTKDNKFYRITIRLNPEWTGPSDSEHKKFQLLNETKLNKKTLKLGATLKTKTKDKVNLNAYTVIPFMSNKIGISQDELVKEAEAYFDSYNMNGIEGTLTLFGDLNLHSGEKVELLDERQPEKNGWYLVEEVNTKFGVNGYRQTIKIPYCIGKPEKE